MSFDMRGARGNQEIEQMVRDGLAAGIEGFDRFVLSRRVQGILNDERDVG